MPVATQGEKNPLHVTLVTCNRLNGPSKVLTATRGGSRISEKGGLLMNNN